MEKLRYKQRAGRVSLPFPLKVARQTNIYFNINNKDKTYMTGFRSRHLPLNTFKSMRQHSQVTDPLGNGISQRHHKYRNK